MLTFNESMSQHVIYMDYQASTPIDARASNAMIAAYKDAYGNPSSPHLAGMQASSALEASRWAISKYLNIAPASLHFTSGSTEANNLAIKGVCRARSRGHIISCATEHKSVLNPLHQLRQEGFEVTILPVANDGSIDLDELRRVLRPDTILGSFMFANNEIGTIHPVREIAKILHAGRILFHCDATQGLANFRVHPRALGIDLMSCSSHKLYGPKGCGFLYVDPDAIDSAAMRAELLGGEQEGSIRAGTQNVPGIVGLAEAFRVLDETIEADQIDNECKRAAFLKGIQKKFDCQINGSATARIASNLSISFKERSAMDILRKAPQILASMGSACGSLDSEGSHVLKAIGLSTNYISSTIRFGFGRSTSLAEVERAATMIASCTSAK